MLTLQIRYFMESTMYRRIQKIYERRKNEQKRKCFIGELAGDDDRRCGCMMKALTAC